MAALLVRRVKHLCTATTWNICMDCQSAHRRVDRLNAPLAVVVHQALGVNRAIRIWLLIAAMENGGSDATIEQVTTVGPEKVSTNEIFVVLNLHDLQLASLLCKSRKLVQDIAIGIDGYVRPTHRRAIRDYYPDAGHGSVDMHSQLESC